MWGQRGDIQHVGGPILKVGDEMVPTIKFHVHRGVEGDTSGALNKIL